ncbi:8-oxo-dGTP pyrophosphatase MutT (NUDIX family) [Saccharomonospora amisosensis]|uniref:8-oxo-dGTP pyrophosphatase MutT (NUDIX family) n=1 Tax=Saccharomonospora amisosensis TaxID=1128677 RepID=A0A7X5UUK8_9PSEU|nr:NUDIX hydrolase [Saccharomonospora amisosensis]NIJ13993.1 8-oxo-dGTP pyrophosphatase MutT (NUDIX family) [Saccharomonospora amisosensis]
MVSALHINATAALRAWRPYEAAQESLRQSYLGFLAAREDACERSCAPGHLTASAVVLDEPGERVLLTLHPRVGRWLQLGGHCEPEDSSLADAALREAREESGIEELTLDPEPVRLEVHPITCSLGAPTRHFDVQFVVRAPREAQPVASDESDDLRWWPVHALPEGTEELTELIAAALDRRRTGLTSPRPPRHLG